MLLRTGESNLADFLDRAFRRPDTAADGVRHGSAVKWEDGASAVQSFSEQRYVPKSILDAVRDGQWDFEPESMGRADYQPTEAIPGSTEKLQILCERIRRGLPLWHPDDRRFYASPATNSTGRP